MSAAPNFCTQSSSSLPRRRFSSFPSPRLIPLPSRFHKGVSGQRFQLLKVHCASGWRNGISESESKSGSNPRRLLSLFFLESSSSSSSAAPVVEDNGYKWFVALGGIGFLETAHMTYMKLIDSNGFCPLGEDSCSAILTSDYSSLLGAPLSSFGMLAYGLVAILGLQLQRGPKKAFGIEKNNGEMILLGTTTSMVVSSAYFLYILNTEFVGESCLYSLASAALPISLFCIAWKSFGFDKIRGMLGSKLCMASLLFIALSTSCYAVHPLSSSLAATEMPYVEKEITKESSPLALSLARHLQSIGAKLYGAFWCSHCVEQKQMFGHEAAKMLDYVECFPDGVEEGSEMAKACIDAELKWLPTWEINGKVYGGAKQLPELARLSGFKLDDLSQN